MAEHRFRSECLTSALDGVDDAQSSRSLAATTRPTTTMTAR
jgi:hypothetical protein